MNIRFGGVMINLYQFDPAKVPLGDRHQLTMNLLGGMRQQFGQVVSEVEPAEMVGPWIGNVPKNKFQLNAFQVVTRTEPTLLKRLQDFFYVSKSVRGGLQEHVKLALLEIQEKATGAVDLVTVALDKHDEDVEQVFSEDMMAHMPFSALEPGALTERGGFAVNEKKTGRIRSEAAINRQWANLKSNLEARFNAS